MATKPNAEDYALPPSCISADETAEGGLAKHLEPLCLSLAERVLLYNQEVLFLQGKEILQGLAKLNPNGVAAAAVEVGHAPAARLGPATAANGGLAPAANPGPAAAGISKVKPYAEAYASAARVARVLAPAFKKKAHAAEDEETRKKVLKGVEGLTRNAAKTILAKDKDILSDAESSETEDGEQATTKNEEISQTSQRLARVTQRLDTIQSRSPYRPYYEGQWRRALLKLRELGVAAESAHNDIVPIVRTAPVGKTVEKDGARAARVEEKDLNKRARSPVLTSNSEAEERRAFEQTENQHRNKKVKVEVEVKVKSEPGNGAL